MQHPTSHPICTPCLGTPTWNREEMKAPTSPKLRTPQSERRMLLD